MHKDRKKEIIFEAIPISPGISIGPAFIFRKFSLDIEELDLTISNVEEELDKFKKAVKKTIVNLEDTKKMSEEIYGDKFLEIFESQIELLRDQIFMKEIENEIRKQKRPAAYVVFKVFRKKKEYFLNLDSAYFRDRAFDIADLKQKILNVIFDVGIDYNLSIPSIVIADNLTPTDTVHFNRNLILGFITDTGGKTSHSAIMAQSLHIPSVVDKNNLSKVIKSGDMVILDGYAGKIILNPDSKTVKEYSKKKKKYNAFEKELLKEIEKPAETIDGCKICIMANAEFLQEIDEIKQYGAEGIGLFRTEGLFLERDHLPGEDEQYTIYKKLSEEMGNLPVMIRTVDAGGDKLIKDLNEANEMNPFLGWRAIRVCLDEKEIFKTQLKAILRANINGNIQIILPMISCLNEIILTKEIIADVKKELNEAGLYFFEKTKVGIMVETPSAALMANDYAKEVDFFSIGTNDLTQYTLAVDRTNLKVSKLFNDSHPAVLKLIQHTLNTARQSDLEVSVCGELAGDPLSVAMLIGMGIRHLSVSTFLIPKIKKIIRSISVRECKSLAEKVMESKTAIETDEINKKFFREKFKNMDYLI